MGNRLITVDEAARQLASVLQHSIADAKKAGATDQEIADDLTDFFGWMGGFPPEQRKDRRTS